MTVTSPVIGRYKTPMLLDQGRKTENCKDELWFYDTKNNEKIDFMKTENTVIVG